MKFGTKVAMGWGWCPNIEYMQCAEKVCITKLDDEKYDMRCSDGAWDMMPVVVTVFCNQPVDFALDLGDDQSHYLYVQ